MQLHLPAKSDGDLWSVFKVMSVTLKMVFTLLVNLQCFDAVGELTGIYVLYQ